MGADAAGKGRLLLLVDEFPVVSQTFVVAHALGMQRRGWDVAVCARAIDRARLARIEAALPTFEIGPDAERLRRQGGLRHRFELLRAFGASEAFRLLRVGARSLRRSERALALAFFEVARRLRPAAIHAHFGTDACIAAPAARRLGVPLLANFRGWDFLNSVRSRGWQRYSILPRDTRAIAHTGFCRDMLRRELACEIDLVRRGVDRERFRPAERGKAWPTPLRMLTVGRMFYGKGHHLALEAAALLRHLRPELDFELALAGGGEREDALRARAKLLGLDARVEFPGALSHQAVAEAMRRADVLLVPSLPRANGWVENFCTVASEGLASGCAVIGVNNGGMPETIAAGGLLVNPGSALELAEAIVRLLRTSTPRSAADAALIRAAELREDVMLDDYERVTRAAVG